MEMGKVRSSFVVSTEGHPLPFLRVQELLFKGFFLQLHCNKNVAFGCAGGLYGDASSQTSQFILIFLKLYLIGFPQSGFSSLTTFNLPATTATGLPDLCCLQLLGGEKDHMNPCA